MSYSLLYFNIYYFIDSSSKAAKDTTLSTESITDIDDGESDEYFLRSSSSLLNISGYDSNTNYVGLSPSDRGSKPNEMGNIDKDMPRYKWIPGIKKSKQVDHKQPCKEIDNITPCSVPLTSTCSETTTLYSQPTHNDLSPQSKISTTPILFKTPSVPASDMTPSASLMNHTKPSTSSSKVRKPECFTTPILSTRTCPAIHEPTTPLTTQCKTLNTHTQCKTLSLQKQLVKLPILTDDMAPLASTYKLPAMFNTPTISHATPALLNQPVATTSCDSTTNIAIITSTVYSNTTSLSSSAIDRTPEFWTDYSKESANHNSASGSSNAVTNILTSGDESSDDITICTGESAVCVIETDNNLSASSSAVISGRNKREISANINTGGSHKRRYTSDIEFNTYTGKYAIYILCVQTVCRDCEYRLVCTDRVYRIGVHIVRTYNVYK